MRSETSLDTAVHKREMGGESVQIGAKKLIAFARIRCRHGAKKRLDRAQKRREI
jgi:hypothetical protein